MPKVKYRLLSQETIISLCLHHTKLLFKATGRCCSLDMEPLVDINPHLQFQFTDMSICILYDYNPDSDYSFISCVL